MGKNDLDIFVRVVIMSPMCTILEKWEITETELTQIVKENPSLRAFMMGYIAEHKVRKEISSYKDISNIKKYDDHDRTHKGDISFIFNSKEYNIEVKSLQTNSVKHIQEETLEWSGKFQCDASDRRTVPLPSGRKIETTCLLVGEFDIVAVNLFAFGGEWKYAYAKNNDLPHPKYRKSLKGLLEEDMQYLIASTISITWPLSFPFTENLYDLL